MKFARDKRTRKWPALLRSRAGEEIPVTFDPQFWDREVNVGDRRTVFVEVGEQAKDLAFGAETDPNDVYYDLRLGKVDPFDRKNMFDADGNWPARGPVVHTDVLAMYTLASDPKKLQVEIKVVAVHEPVPATDPYAEVPDGAES